MDMELSKTDKLIHKWIGILEKGWNHETIDPAEIRALFRETSQHLEEYGSEHMIPKEVAGLIDTIRDFESDVYSIENHSLQHLATEITDVIVVMNEAFYTNDFANTDVKSYINKIRD